MPALDDEAYCAAEVRKSCGVLEHNDETSVGAEELGSGPEGGSSGDDDSELDVSHDEVA